MYNITLEFFKLMEELRNSDESLARFEFVKLTPHTASKHDVKLFIESKGIPVYLVEGAPNGFIVWRTKEEHDEFYDIR